MSMYADRYDALRGKVDRTMDNLNAAKNLRRFSLHPAITIIKFSSLTFLSIRTFLRTIDFF